ncbi:MAG: hypothetical protein J7578_03470 [Chitinophagaceae bacterium]|nr:hypothetical protein [Chitinophagaceae bacterium]
MKLLLTPVMVMALLCTFNIALSQQQFVLPQLSPKSPNAAALDRYGEIPVSLTNGTANISIPLYSIRAGALEIPILLQYNYNGLKMDEIPSFTGLGWSLIAGGIINYEQRGLPDFDLEGSGMFTNGTYHAKDSLQLFLSNKMPANRANAYLQLLTEGVLDGEFDLYQYTLPGYQGSFFLDQDQKIIMVPQNNLRATRGPGSLFTITDEKGNEWQFNTTDKNATGPDAEPQLLPGRGFNGSASIYLSQVKTINNRNIRFTYTPYPFSYAQSQKSVNVMSAKPYDDCPDSRSDLDRTHYYLENNLLREILFDEGRILFEMSTEPRNDIRKIAPAASIPFLSKMQVLDRNNKLILEYCFEYTNGNRLQLDAIRRTSLTDTPMRWQFKYEGSEKYPAIFSNGKDHWGFYNGIARGIPHAGYETLAPGWKGNASPVNRESNFEYGKTGLLRHIRYPTGGHAALHYEPNSILFTDPTQLQSKDYLQFQYPRTLVPVIEANTDESAEVEGYFTLDSSTQVEIYAYRASQPKALINSVVMLTEMGTTRDLLPFLLKVQCSPYACELKGSTQLAPGTYRYFLKRSDQDLENVEGNARLSIFKTAAVTSPVAASRYTVGGARIASIEHFDGTGSSMIKRYRYLDSYESLGFINIPQYISRTRISVNHYAACSLCGIRSSISEDSQLPLSGNPVEYLQVTEFSGKDDSQGATVFQFTPNQDYNAGGNAPYLHPFKLNWRSGLLSSKRIFRNNNGRMELVVLDSNTYAGIPVPGSITRGIKATYATYCPIRGLQFNSFNYQLPTYFTERYYCKNQSQYFIDSSGSLLTFTEQVPGSSKHTLPTEIRNSNKAGVLSKERISYSFDYDTLIMNDPEAKGIRCLQRKNILLPVEKLSIRTIFGVDHIVGAILLTYKADTPVTDKIFELHLPEPLPLAQFTGSRIQAGNFTRDSRYTQTVHFRKYDPFLNILDAVVTDQPEKAWIWSRSQQYPLCEAIGTNQQQLACTSFEDDQLGNWQSNQLPEKAIVTAPKLVTGLSSSLVPAPAYAITGKCSWDLVKGSLFKSGLTKGKTYILSYWSRAGVISIAGATGKMINGSSMQGWTYFEHTLISSKDTIYISGSGQIDELRLYPQGANIKTYTYEPLIGLTSECDANNKIIYYEYDHQGRLMHIRDGKRNILKKMEYNYSSQ